jgi:hypothetical protein
LNDVGVADLLQYFDFTSNSLNIFLIFNFVLFKDFYRNLLASQGVSGLLDLPERALA